MKKIYLSICLVLSTMIVYSQTWSSANMLSGTDDLTIISTASDSQNNTYLFGHFFGSLNPTGHDQINSHGGRDLFLAKFDTESQLVWIKGIGGSANEFIYGGLGITKDEDLFITGGFQNYLHYNDNDSIESTGSHDIFLAKYTLDGDNIWCKNIGQGANYQRATSLGVDAENNILVSGYFADSIVMNNDTTLYKLNDFKDYYIAKFEPVDGSLIWAKSFKSLNTDYSGFIYSIKASSNSYYLSGVFSDSIDMEIDTIVSETSQYYDTHVIKMNPSGELDWIRLIKGAVWDYSYTSTLDPEDNIYVTGYFNSPVLTIDSSESKTIIRERVGLGYDFFIAKYEKNGFLSWIRLNGGKGEDRLLRSEFVNNELHVSGYFADTLKWGGIQLITKGTNDQDMFSGTLDADGNYRSANSFGGRNNSTEMGVAVFNTAEDIYSVIRSNSDLLVLGDSIFTSTSGKFYIVMGVTGCRLINIDNVITTNITTCYGDSTGAIQVLATGGFGSPWQYSIDNGDTYQTDNSYFDSLPAGNYPVVVVDKEGCAQPGPVVTVNQPDMLEVDIISVIKPTETETGLIQVAGLGGTSPYTFTLQPDGTIQGFGTYTIPAGDTGIYYVEVNDLRNCGPVATDSISMITSVDPSFAPETRVYPNPTSGMFTLEMPTTLDVCSIEVLSLTGQVVYRHQAYSTGGMILEVMDISHLSKGMYMLRVNGKTLRSGVVVN